VLLKIVYLLFRRIVSLAILVFRDDMAKDAELLVLRHENTVLRRRPGRIRYEPADRVWFAALTQLIPRRYGAGIFPVTPATLLVWHHKLAARKYGTSRRRKPGRPPTVRASPASPSERRKRIRCGAGRRSPRTPWPAWVLAGEIVDVPLVMDGSPIPGAVEVGEIDEAPPPRLAAFPDGQLTGYVHSSHHDDVSRLLAIGVPLSISLTEDQTMRILVDDPTGRPGWFGEAGP
jgi:hypothetical protein